LTDAALCTNVGFSDIGQTNNRGDIRMLKFQILLCALFLHIANIVFAQQSILPIDACLAPNANLDAQILACDVAIQHSHASAAVKAYLPPILAELRREEGDFYSAFAQMRGSETTGADLLLAMAQSQHAEHRYDLAITFFQAAYADYENYEKVQIENLSFLEEIESLFEAQPEELVRLTSIGLEQAPTDPFLLQMRAINLIKLGRLEEGFSDWEAAMQSARYSHVYRYERALAYFRQGLVDDAFADLRYLSEQLKPGGTYERELLADIGLFDDYRAQIHQRVIDRLPGVWTDVFHLRVLISKEIEDTQAAFDAIADWQINEPDNVRAMVAKAELLAENGRFDEALIEFNAAVAQANLNDNGVVGLDGRLALPKRAQFFVHRGEIELAMQDLDLFLTYLAGYSPGDIEALQRYFSNLGFFDGEIDGEYNEQTRNGLQRCFEAGSCDDL
jgi:tetratricopeptide (TPR) repeat protein